MTGRSGSRWKLGSRLSETWHCMVVKWKEYQLCIERYMWMLSSQKAGGLCGLLILCFVAQPHPFILDFVLLRLGICKWHFSFASWLPTRFCQKRAQKETRKVPAASCFALCSCLHHPMVLPLTVAVASCFLHTLSLVFCPWHNSTTCLMPPCQRSGSWLYRSIPSTF